MTIRQRRKLILSIGLTQLGQLLLEHILYVLDHQAAAIIHLPVIAQLAIEAKTDTKLA
jgi:hypothetical protein